MRTIILFIISVFSSFGLLQAQNEALIRIEYPNEFDFFKEKSTEKALENIPETPEKQNQKEKITKVTTTKIAKVNYQKRNFSENRAIIRNLKTPSQLDSLPPQKSSLQKLGCFLREPLDLITLGVEMFELTKPPKSPFLVILYVIYIVPLFAIITSFIIGGILGLVSFILACGIFAFLLYWLTLALLGIVLAGNLILWGLIGAFVFGLILYLMLIRLC